MGDKSQRWTLDMLYALEPELKKVAARAVAHKRQQLYDRLDVYTAIKNEAEKLVGWFARDPSLRTSDAWDCFFNYVLEVLRL